METPDASVLLAALGHPSRLAVFRLLVEAGPRGMSAGAIAGSVGLAAPRLSYHLAHLARVGLVGRRQEKSYVFYSANFALVDDLLCFLTANCCQGKACLPGMAASRAAAPRRGKV